MAKKRGGLAGVWDRNKGAIKTLAPIAAGFIPGVGPLIGAGLGAAMGGLDRPGKSGIGLDVMGAVKGGVKGYGGAKLGQAAKGGLAKMFTGGSPIDKLTGAPKMGVMTQTTGSAMSAPTLAGAPSVGLTAGAPSSYGAIGSYQPTLAGAGQSTGGDGFSLGRLFGKDGMIEQNKTLLSGIGKGVMGTRNAALEAQTAEDARLQREAELKQRQYEFDKTYGIDAAQEADRKRREDQLQAQRAAFRAMFTGTA